MGFFFTLIFVFMAYYSPQAVLGDIAQYHIEVLVAAVTFVMCLFSASGSGVSRLPQTYAIIGLVVSVALSLLLVWPGSIPTNLMEFIPNVMVFFFIVWSFKTKRQLQCLVLILLSAALFTIYKGYSAQLALEYRSLYVLMMRNDDLVWFFRIRGLTFLNDPNDLAQFLVTMVPMSFFLWKKGNALRNLLFVYLPCAGLVFGMFLTHSRGGMVALMVVVIMAGRKKIGVLPSIIGGGAVFAGLVASGFSGGREVGAGDDRMAAWSTGLTLIRTHPVFGVGFKRFTEYYEITAHNTIVVTAAELGLVGLFFWLLFTVTSVRDLVQIVSAPKPLINEDAAPEPASFRRHLKPARQALASLSFSNASLATANGARLPLHRVARTASPSVVSVAATPAVQPGGSTAATYLPSYMTEALPDIAKQQAEVRRLANVMLCAFSGFLAASWFLSRPYTMSLFVNAGIGAVILRMARESGIEVEPMPLPRAAKIAAFATVGLILGVYIFLRLDHLLPK